MKCKARKKPSFLCFPQKGMGVIIKDGAWGRDESISQTLSCHKALEGLQHMATNTVLLVQEYSSNNMFACTHSDTLKFMS